MAIIYSYPLTTPKVKDLLIGTSVFDEDDENSPRNNPTVSFTIKSLLDMIGTGGFQTLQQVTNLGASTTNAITIANGLSVTGTFTDSTGGVGTAGQVLSSTNIGTAWINDNAGLNYYVTGATFDTATGILAITGNDALVGASIDLDGRYLTANQTITLSGDVSGSGETAITTTLATVNTNIGAFTNANITVNAKGLVTAAASGTSGVDTVTTTDGTYIDLTPTTVTTGAVTVTADLNAPGTQDATTFLRGDNTWDVPAYIPNTDETYDLNAGAKVSTSVPINLTSTSGTDNSLVNLKEGTNITLTRGSATEITIAATGSSDNWYVTGGSFNATTGVLAITGNDAAVGATIDLDGRYMSSLTTTGTGASTFNAATGILNIPDYTYTEIDTLQSVCARGNSTSTAINMIGSGASGYLYVTGNAQGNQPTNSTGMAFSYNNNAGLRENELFWNPGIVTAADNATFSFSLVNEYLDSANSNARVSDRLFKLYGNGNLELTGPPSTSTIANTYWRMPKVAGSPGQVLARSSATIDLEWVANGSTSLLKTVTNTFTASQILAGGSLTFTMPTVPVGKQLLIQNILFYMAVRPQAGGPVYFNAGTNYSVMLQFNDGFSSNLLALSNAQAFLNQGSNGQILMSNSGFGEYPVVVGDVVSTGGGTMNLVLSAATAGQPGPTTGNGELYISIEYKEIATGSAFTL